MKNNLPKIMVTHKKRVGRGYGSGKGGHTVGRGQKGQKARGGINVVFEGMKMKKSLIKRLPFMRGRLKLTPGVKPLVLTLTDLNKLPAGSKVTVDTLVQRGIVSAENAKKYGVKILGDGTLEKKLEVLLPVSKSAAKKIESAGGKITQ